MTHPERGLITSPSSPTTLLIGIFLMLLTAALRFGAGLLLPIALAGLFTLLLDPPVRALQRLGLPTAIGAALVVFGTMAVLVTGAVRLSGPAATWVESAPKTLGKVQTKIRRMIRPLQETAQKVDAATETAPPAGIRTVQIKTPGVLQRITGSTISIAGKTMTVVFLTYFLLAMLPAFRKKLAGLIGSQTGVRDMEAVLTEIEVQMSRYMLLTTLTSVGVGLATWGFLAVVGLPNPLLWGVAACFLNFIPYAGSLVTAVLVGIAALAAFDTTGMVVLAVGGCVVINLLEGNFVTPHLMGRHLPLNPVAIFVSLLYWGWVWGATGALLAVPITVMLQVIFARIEKLRPVAVLMDS
jgi:predicted PurR-regulated permease PerM